MNAISGGWCFLCITSCLEHVIFSWLPDSFCIDTCILTIAIVIDILSNSIENVCIWQVLYGFKRLHWICGMVYIRAAWASYQIRKIAGCACTENAGNVFPATDFKGKPLVSDPGLHHGTCVTHVPWCMSGSLTRGSGENVPGILGVCATRNFTYLVRGPYCKSMKPRETFAIWRPVKRLILPDNVYQQTTDVYTTYGTCKSSYLQTVYHVVVLML